MHVALPNAACPGLHQQKPLDAVIEQLLTPYCPGNRQGNDQQNDNEKHTYCAGHFAGHRGVPVLYSAHRPMEEVMAFLEATGHRQWARIFSNSINRTC